MTQSILRNLLSVLLEDISLTSSSKQATQILARNDDTNDIPHIITEGRIGIENTFPFAFSTCNQDMWVTVGMEAFLMKIIANSLGISRCVKYEGDFDAIDIFAPSEMIPSEIPGWSFIYPHKKSDLCIIVQSALPVKYDLWNAFCVPTWLLTGVTLPVFTVVMQFYGLRSALLQVFKTFLTGSFPENGPPVRNGLLLSLSMTGLILVSAFSGIFTSFLSVQKGGREADTLEDVNKIISKLFIYQGDAKYFKSLGLDQNDVLLKLLQKAEFLKSGKLTDFRKAINDTANSPGIGMVVRSGSVDFFIANNPQLFNINGKVPLHLVKECISSPNYDAFPVRANWELRNKFNEKLMRLVDAGIPEKLYRLSMFDWRTYDMVTKPYVIKPTTRRTTTNEPMALGLVAILQPLVLLGVGSALASLAVVAELTVPRSRWFCFFNN